VVVLVSTLVMRASHADQPAVASPSDIATSQQGAAAELMPGANLRLFLTANQLRRWQAKTLEGTFSEQFELGGRSQPAHGVTRTTVAWQPGAPPRVNTLDFDVTSLVGTRMAPTTVIGSAQIDAQSVVRANVKIILRDDRLVYAMGPIVCCSQLQGAALCQRYPGRVGNRLKRRIFDRVVESKSEQIVAKLNQKIANNLREQIDQRMRRQIHQINATLDKLRRDLEVQGIDYRIASRASLAGLQIDGLLQDRGGSPPVLAPLAAPAEGCWLALHQSAINSLQPLLDNQTVDQQTFRRYWLSQLLPGAEAVIPPPRQDLLPGSEDQRETAGENRLLFGDKAVEFRFDRQTIAVLLRIEGMIRSGQVSIFPEPVACRFDYLLDATDSSLKIELNQSHFDALTPEQERVLEEFVPRVIRYTRYSLEPVLAEQWQFRIGRPTADKGWLIVPLIETDAGGEPASKVTD
jgi:hypothetical protein